MASIAIGSATPSNAVQPVATAKAALAPAQTTAKAPAVLKPDTVKLSPAAQARMMHRAGQSPSLIATTLGTNIRAVDGYLNIKVAVQAAPAPAAPAEEAEPTAQPGSKTQPQPAAQAAAPAPTTAPEAEGEAEGAAAKG